MPRLSLTVPRAVCPLFSALVLAAGLCGCHSTSSKTIPASWSQQTDGSWKYVPPAGTVAGTVPGEYWIIREAEAPAQAGNPHAAPPVKAGQSAGDGAFNPGVMPAPARQRPIAPPPPDTHDTAPPPPQLRDGGSPVFPEIRPQAGMLERLSSGLKSMMPGSSAESVAKPAAVHPAGSQKLQPLPLSSTMPSTGPWHDGFANPVQLGPLRAELETEEQPEAAGEARRVVAWQQGQNAAAQGWGDQWQASPSSLGGRMEVPGPPSQSAEIEPWPFHPDRLAQRIGQSVRDADAPRSDEGTAAVPSSLRPSNSASQHAPVMPAPRRHRTSSVPPLFPVH